MPKGYIVARIVVTNPEQYAEYVKDASEAIRKYGGKPRNPTHVDRQAPNLDGQCGPGAPWRGANHAPAPLAR